MTYTMRLSKALDHLCTSRLSTVEISPTTSVVHISNVTAHPMERSLIRSLEAELQHLRLRSLVVGVLLYI